MSLKEYNLKSKANAYMIIGAVEFVKNSYMDKFVGSEALGHLLALGRNTALDIIDTSDALKFNF